MKIEISTNIRKEDEWRIERWFRLFGKMMVMAEDETFDDVKINGKEFNLYTD